MGDDYKGVERRKNALKGFGYLNATVDRNSQDIRELKRIIESHIESQNGDIKELSENLQKVVDELNIYKAGIRLLKLLGASALLILTFKFGDISSIWGDGTNP